MDIDLTRNYFELFGIPESFVLDQKELVSRYRAFQRTLHPDRYSGESSQEQRIALQQTAFVNEAYGVLKSDLKRALYLLKLQDLEFDPDTETSRDTGFLMQQMELHEQVAAVDEAEYPAETLDELAGEFRRQQQDLIARFSGEYEQGHLDAAKDLALKLQFYERLTSQLKDKREKLEDQLL